MEEVDELMVIGSDDDFQLTFNKLLVINLTVSLNPIFATTWYYNYTMLCK